DQGPQLAALLRKTGGGSSSWRGIPPKVGLLLVWQEDRTVGWVGIPRVVRKAGGPALSGAAPKLRGRLEAALWASLVPPDSRVAVITGMLSAEEHCQKWDGFKKGYHEDCSNTGEVAVLEAHESEEESYRKTCDLLEHYPDLRGIYVSTVNCLPVCRALE